MVIGFDERGSAAAPSEHHAPFALLIAQELFDCQVDIGSDLAQERRRDIAPLVKRNGRAATIWMAELLMRTSLPNFLESVLL
jgi:hypothetical protein